MAYRFTRRQFLHGAAGTIAAQPLLAGHNGTTAAEAGDAPLRGPRGASRVQVEDEIRRRARRQLAQTRLVVDYYRIGRRLAYPLPLRRLSLPGVQVPGISAYPWATWLVWTLEERITCLGWAAEWFADEQARTKATADLDALAEWPVYQQYDGPDLSSAHAGRVLWTAATRWRWPDDALRRRVRAACHRHAQLLSLASNKLYSSVTSRHDVLGPTGPRVSLHNIPLIGLLGAALTAAAAEHPTRKVLNGRLHALFGAVLELRAKGYGEGLAYDGYVLDFVADWLSALPEAERLPILDHPSLRQYLEQSYRLGAPGAAHQVAEIGDVEPLQMPFHLSAQAKLLRLRADPLASWLLGRCPVEVLRSDGLAALGSIDPLPAGRAPVAGALDAHYAAVLRSGWEAEDLAVAVSCSNSPMGHLQSDSGTLVIGTRGEWLIADPGYQQYAPGDEREFTVGPAAHNAPLIDGRAMTQKRARLLARESTGSGMHRLAIDLTACYPALAAVKAVVRNVWLAGKTMVVVADEIQAGPQSSATYHWHGASRAAWWFEGGAALITLGQARLWIAGSRVRLNGGALQRLPGSRGQLTLVAKLDGAGPVVWWVFALADSPPELKPGGDGRELHVGGQIFRVQAPSPP